MLFLVLSHNHISDSSNIELLKFKIEHIKVFKGIDYCFNGFDTPFSKKLNEFFTFVFNCSFYFVFLIFWNFLDKENL